jgi:hypothetical protein
MPRMNVHRDNNNNFAIFQIIIRYDKVGACGIILLNLIILVRSCKISEFACKGSGLCLPLDRYCDGIDHCGDFSDEPKFCTGELGEAMTIN